jgi:hydroxymethylbilane synthase
VQTRLRKLREGECQASLLALAGLRRLNMDIPNAHAPSADIPNAGVPTVLPPNPGVPNFVVLDPEVIVPSAAQGIIGITVRADDTALLDRLALIEDPVSRTVATAERAMLATLDGSCRTPIGAHARMLPNGDLTLTGLVARADGSFLIKRTLAGPPADAFRIGTDLGAILRAAAPADLFG